MRATLESDGKQPFGYEELCNLGNDGELIDHCLHEPLPIRFLQGIYTGGTQRSKIQSTAYIALHALEARGLKYANCFLNMWVAETVAGVKYPDQAACLNCIGTVVVTRWLLRLGRRLCYCCEASLW